MQQENNPNRRLHCRQANVTVRIGGISPVPRSRRHKTSGHNRYSHARCSSSRNSTDPVYNEIHTSRYNEGRYERDFQSSEIDELPLKSAPCAYFPSAGGESCFRYEIRSSQASSKHRFNVRAVGRYSSRTNTSFRPSALIHTAANYYRNTTNTKARDLHTDTKEHVHLTCHMNTVHALIYHTADTNHRRLPITCSMSPLTCFTPPPILINAISS